MFDDVRSVCSLIYNLFKIYFQTFQFLNVHQIVMNLNNRVEDKTVIILCLVVINFFIISSENRPHIFQEQQATTRLIQLTNHFFQSQSSYQSKLKIIKIRSKQNIFTKQLLNILFFCFFNQLFDNSKQKLIRYMTLHFKSTNVCARFLHLGLQIIAGYWAVVIDGYGCQQAFVRNVTYFAYAMIAFNLILFALFSSRGSSMGSGFALYIPYIVNLGLVAGALYFTIEGYNRYNNCGPSRALYEFFFIQIIISLVLFLMIAVGDHTWSGRFANWPGNLAWAILFLKVGFPGVYHSPAIAIGIIVAIICATSLIVNAYTYQSAKATGSGNILKSQWAASLILLLGLQILAIVMLVTTSKDGDYWWVYCRKIFVIFAGVNIIDMFMCYYGFRNIGLSTVDAPRIA